MSGPRLRVDPRDVPAEKAARRLGLMLPEFEERKYALFDRGFPQADATTGLYDIEAINRWCDARFPHLYPETRSSLTAEPQPRDAREVSRGRLARLANGQR